VFCLHLHGKNIVFDFFQQKSSKEFEKHKHTKRAFWLMLQAFKNISESVETIPLKVLKGKW
jgi:hypothetical protein